MAKLYCKVASDIRAGLGCRGDKSMEASLLFSYSGGRSADGGIRVCVSESSGRFHYKITALLDGKETLVKNLVFPLDRNGKP
jgi:hypothetical protein